MVHLFIDNQTIEMVEVLTRVFHRPQKDNTPLIVPDEPWEHIPYFGNHAWSLIHDSKAGLFHCWYEDMILYPEKLVGSNVDITDPSVHRSRLCYAVSNDGLNWEKPPLGLVHEDGHDTNVVLGASPNGPEGFGCVHAAYVLDDPLESDTSRRFKMIFQHITTAGAAGDTRVRDFGSPQILQSPIRMAYSPDGIHWTVDDAELDFGGLGPRLGDVMVLTCNVEREEYVLHTRHKDAWKVPLNPKLPRTAGWSLPFYPGDPARLNTRRIWHCTSHDLINWNEPEMDFKADEIEDNLDESFYAMRSWPIGDLHLAFLTVFQSVDNVCEPHLVYSRNERTWHRTAKRAPFIPLGAPGSWDEFMTIITSPPIPMGDELWIYYGGSNVHHDWWQTGAREGLDVPEAKDLGLVKQGIGLARLRLNGFASLRAGPVREGLLTTRPITKTGSQLEINAACRNDGSIQIELADENDDVLAGFARNDCDTFTNDSVRHRYSWHGRSEVDTLGPIKLRIWMRNADLYSIQWID